MKKTFSILLIQYTLKYNGQTCSDFMIPNAGNNKIGINAVTHIGNTSVSQNTALKNELSYKIYITDKFQINHNNYNKCTF
jgi:hypothetical protein